MVKIAVVGGSISGLSSAVCIQETLPDVKVTVLSDAFSPNTTADVAPGVLFPYFLTDTPLELQMRWFKMTVDHIAGLYHHNQSNEYGISLLSGYVLFSHQEDFPSWRNYVIGLRELSNEEMRGFLNIEVKSGWFLSTYVCECRSYLPYLMKRFTNSGGIIQQKKVENLNNLADDFDIIVTCCGIEAKELANDAGVYPEKGQVIQVAAPWIKHFYAYRDTYIMPQQNMVILGGTSKKDEYQLTPTKEDHDAIYKKCCKVIPTLEHCKIIQDKAGLRTGRDGVRLEKGSPVKGIRKEAQVVYNYGHGSGITLHWGCANDVAQIVSGILQNSSQ